MGWCVWLFKTTATQRPAMYVPFLLATPVETQVPLVYIPSSIMIPQRRLATLLLQAREQQYSRCVYHNSPLDSTPSSLYTDHHCNKSDFPNTTTTILQGHKDEVWNMQWSHGGAYLATCGKDKSAIIWNAGVRCVVSWESSDPPF